MYSESKGDEVATDINALVAVIGIGLIAGLFLDVVAFLLVVVTPTLVVVAATVALSTSMSAWLIPTAWIAQQAAYLLVLHLARPRTYRHVLERVRVMMKL
jgi:hypothetical protein